MSSTWQWSTRTAGDKWQRLRSTVAGKRTVVIASVVLGAVVLTAGGALATRAASNQFANAALSKLGGGDPEAVLNSIADRVVKQLTSKSGILGQASASLTDEIGKAAGTKLAGIDTDSLLDNVSADVIAAGMGKLDEISTDEIVADVTNALIHQVRSQIESLDLLALAHSKLDGAADELLGDVDIEKLIKERLDGIDVEKLASDAIKDYMESQGGSGGLLGLLFKR